MIVSNKFKQGEYELIVIMLIFIFIQNSSTTILVCMLTLSKILQKLFSEWSLLFPFFKNLIYEMMKYAAFIAFEAPLIPYMPLSKKATTKNIVKIS